MRHLPRWSLFLAFVLVLVIVALFSTATTFVRRPYPQTDGELSITGLSAPVEVVRDTNDIANIYADNAEDLFAAQGFVHAQDRFYEMDIRRHITSGRLAELFGPSQVPTDSYIRTMGWRDVATAELPKLSSSTRRYLDAYAAGVNAYLHSKTPTEISLEYTVLGLTGLSYTPEDWTAVDSLAWLKAMAWDLDGNMGEEIERSVITALRGSARMNDLYPAQDLDRFRPIVSSGTVRNGRFDVSAAEGQGRPAPLGSGPVASGAKPSGDAGASTATLRSALPALEAAGRAEQAIPALVGRGGLDAGIGSNSWVVAGEHTSTGKPLMANDPHLAVSLPSIFEQVGLHCRTISSTCPFDVSGFSFSGMPGVIIGHNGAISWGFTDAYTDTQDLYLEDVRQNTVRTGSTYQPLQVRTEQIKVKGEDEPRSLTVRSSRHGPLLSDVDTQLQTVGAAGRPAGSGYAVALHWQALTPGRTMDALFGMNAAQNVTDFRAATALLDGPPQNIVYADRSGDIGYQLPGKLPIRGRGTGDVPAPGWDLSYDWRGTIPFAELPHLENPPAGYIVTANQTVIGTQYPLKLGADYSYGWRSQEINDRLRSELPITPDEGRQVFSDDTMRYAAGIVPALLKVKITDDWVRQGQHSLVGWDYSAPADSAAAAYFAVTFHDLLELTFHDQMPSELWPNGGDRWYAVMAKLITEPRNPWWDDITTPQVETRDDILVRAMTQSRKEITALMSRDPSGWRWGKLHQVDLVNQTLGTSGIGPVEWLFNRGGYQVGGGSAVVNAMGYDELAGYGVTTGPTMRMLVDWSDLDASSWIDQTGTSGHAFARSYTDQAELWARGEFLPFAYTSAAVDAAAERRLRLVPAG